MTELPETHADLLASKAVAYIGTLGPQGEPQVSAVWFAFDGTGLFFSMSRRRQKVRNLGRDGRVAVAIADPANPYRSLELRGTARIEPDPTHTYANQLSRKYLGRDTTAAELPPDEERVVVWVTPERVAVFPPRQEEA